MTPTFRRWRTTVTVQDLQSTWRSTWARIAPAFVRSLRRHHQALSTRRRRPTFELLQHAEHLIASSIGAAFLARGDVAAVAQTHGFRQGRAQAARRFPRRAAFQREILQTALNHVRQGIAVFDADLQLICSNRQFGENPRAAAAPRAARNTLAGNPRIHGRAELPRHRRQRQPDGNTPCRLYDRGRTLSGAPPGSPHGDRGPHQPDARRRPFITFPTSLPRSRPPKRWNAPMQPWKKRVRGSHRELPRLNSELGSGQEHGRGRQYFEDALSCGGKPRHPAAAERGAALCHEPGRARKRR